MLSAAGSLRWYRDTLAPGVSFDELLAPAAPVVAGSEGLLFLPYLTGERTPHPDPLARGAFVGLTVRHSRAHMTRAVLEGVAYGLRDSFELMKDAGLSNIDQVRISGGGRGQSALATDSGGCAGQRAGDRQHNRGRCLRRGAVGWVSAPASGPMLTRPALPLSQLRGIRRRAATRSPSTTQAIRSIAASIRRSRRHLTPLAE